MVDKSQAVAGATGSTALHVACANGCTKVVDLLLRNGAKINVKDKYASKPIDVAAAKNHMEIVKLLDTFGSMQQMLKGLQEGQTMVKKEESTGRRSMDATLYTQQQRADRLRRPSLPSVFESRQLNIPDISTLPPLPSPTRHSLNTPRPSQDELMNLSKPRRYQHYFQPQQSQQAQLPELASSKSSDDSNYTSMSTHDWYSYGVINQFQDENYLSSLERRAFGLTSPTQTPSAYFTSNDMDDNKIVGRTSLDSNKRPSLDSTPLKRCSSDGGHLRTTALMNAMAANNISLQDDEFGNVIPIDDDEEEGVVDEELPRPSLYDERPEIEQVEKVKKQWWSTGRKSVDIYPTGRPSLEHRRSSIDFRPSFDGLSQLAKKSMESLSRKSIDVDYIPDDQKKSNNGRGFLSKWWSPSTTSSNSSITTVDKK